MDEPMLPNRVSCGDVPRAHGLPLLIDQKFHTTSPSRALSNPGLFGMREPPEGKREKKREKF
jgi:hypothetical protein